MTFENFDQWLTAVDIAVARIIGLGIDDLADWHYHDAYDDGVDPQEAAKEVLANEGLDVEGLL